MQRTSIHTQMPTMMGLMIDFVLVDFHINIFICDDDAQYKYHKLKYLKYDV